MKLIRFGPAGRERPSGPEGVATGRLDLDDAGPEVGQEAGAVGAGDAFGQVEYACTFESESHGASLDSGGAMISAGRYPVSLVRGAPSER